MRLAAFAVLASAYLLMTGCTLQPISPEKAAQYKRVGVVSLMGDRFAAEAVGITVFGNEYRPEHLDIGADELFTEKLKQALSTRYEVVDLSKYRKTLMDTPAYWPGQSRIFGEDRPSVPEVVHRIMGSEGLDAYILVSPGGAQVGDTNQSVGGNGILKLQKLFSDDDYLLHSAYIISVIDGKSYTLEADLRAVSIGKSYFVATQTSPISIPYVPVSSQFWEAPDAHKDEIEKAFATLVDQSVPETLRRANLIGAPPGATANAALSGTAAQKTP